MSASDAATVTASTKRPPALSGGKVGSPATQIASMSIVPLLPTSPETAQALGLLSPRVGYETMVFPAAGNSNQDIQNGDILVVGGTEYTIRSVAPWQRDNEGNFLHLVVEENKTS